MANFWNLIVQSNTFNFIVMLVILGILWQKLNLSSAVEKMKSEIALDAEIKESLDKSKVLAQNVFDEIQTMAQKSVEKIEANVDKIIDNETRKVNTKLSNATADSAINLAKSRLKEMFDANPELHNKHINDAIETLDRISWTK